jgi:hypothetical protein
MWDGPSTAAALRWVVSTEEQRLKPTEHEVIFGNAAFGDEVPDETERLQSVEVTFDTLQRRTSISAKGRRGDGVDEQLVGGTKCWGLIA